MFTFVVSSFSPPIKFQSSCCPYLIVIFLLLSTSMIVHNFSRSVKFWLYLFYKIRGSFYCALQHLCVYLAFSFYCAISSLYQVFGFIKGIPEIVHVGGCPNLGMYQRKNVLKYCNVPMEFCLSKWQWLSSVILQGTDFFLEKKEQTSFIYQFNLL